MTGPSMKARPFGLPRSPLDQASLQKLLEQCRAGDVLLTGQRGGLSTVITRAGGAPVSHALLVVAPGVALEARDARWDLKEQGSGIRLVRLESLADLKFELLIAVRPHQSPDGDAMRAWASGVIANAAPFASVGLTAMAPLLLAAQLEARVQKWGPLRPLLEPMFRRRRRHLAELVADGNHRVICAELVYRGLLSGGVEVDLSVAQFATAMAELPDAPISGGHGSLPTPSEGDLFDQAVPSRIVAKSSLPKPTWRYVMNASHAGWKQLFRRAGRDHSGDKADLVTPADLLKSSTMSELWRWP
jgi:hypothetical protein